MINITTPITIKKTSSLYVSRMLKEKRTPLVHALAKLENNRYKKDSGDYFFTDTFDLNACTPADHEKYNRSGQMNSLSVKNYTRGHLVNILT